MRTVLSSGDDSLASFLPTTLLLNPIPVNTSQIERIKFMTMKIVLIVIGAITLVGIMLLIGKMTEKKD